jgi:hypothetical protein
MSSDLTHKSRISKFKNQAKKSFNRRKTLGGTILAGLLNHKEDSGLSRSPSTINLPRRDSKFDDFGDSKYSDYVNACTPARSPARSESWRTPTLKSANIRKLTTSTSKKDKLADSSSGNSSQDEKTSSETSSENLEDEIDEGFNIYTSTSTLDIRISTTHRIKTTSASPGRKSVRQTLATSEIRQILTKTTHTTNMHTTNFQVPNVPQKSTASGFQIPNNPSKSKFKFTQRRKSLSNNSNNSVESSVSSIPSSSDTAFGSLYSSRSSLGLQNLNFEKVLEDKNSRQTFLQYLMSEHSEEGLLFIIQVRKMEQTVQKDSLISFNLKSKAKLVHDMFIKEYSEREVNLCGVTRDLVSARLDGVFSDKISSSRELNEMILNAFRPAKDEITSLLRRDSFPRFLKYLE